MKNKIKLKKLLIKLSIVSIFFIILLLIINLHEYNIYKNNYNNKLYSIIDTLYEKYPNISLNEIANILNSKENNKDILKKYGIFSDDSIIIENNNTYNLFIIINLITIILFICIVLILFIKYENNKDKEIKYITKYIEEINKKNYSLKINEISEDELSILKNEIYKTTIMLKEKELNSLKDKIDLKNSLEDISHQIKTPLTSILIMLDNIIDNPDMDDISKNNFIRDIKRESININFFVQALLKLSKKDNNLKYIIDTSIKNISTLSELKNININVVGNNNIKINCDFKWQVEALTNILKNSIDYVDNNSNVDINFLENKVYVSLTIKDYGKGILSKDLPHIFERFYKGNNKNLDSIGIGLALSKKIIENENGTIDCKSDNSGTMFIIKYFKNK